MRVLGFVVSLKMIWLKLFEERFNYVSLLINIWIDFIYMIGNLFTYLQKSYTSLYLLIIIKYIFCQSSRAS